MLDQVVRFEALSALLGADVKPLAKFSMKTPTTVGEFIAAAILGSDVLIGGQIFTSTPLLSQYNEVRREFFVDMDNFFDPKYDCDFTNLSSEQQCIRGGESYKRPKGWYRMALKVKDKYPDGNTWLGPDGWREYSAPGEWPVAFHGTTLDGANGIIQSHYKAGNGKQYGRGVYSTPFLDSANAYTKEFTSKKNGKSYKVIMQNRINPLKREQCERLDYWLIPVPVHVSSQQERELMESAIRPYGILIQEVTGW